VSVIPDNIASNTINLSFNTSLNLNGIKPSLSLKAFSLVPYLIIFVLFTFEDFTPPLIGPSKDLATFLSVLITLEPWLP